ncbi:MAG: transporter [Dehalococcoidia bacterium]|nr:transporter [Dehalococcoidia bacterium]
MLTFEGVTSTAFTSITTSGFLAAFALALGASNFHIGVLAAIPFITQLFQIPFILLVERLRHRKAIAVTAWLAAQLLWFPIALIPVFLGVPSAAAVSVLLGLMAIRGLLAAATNCAWNGWIRDLVPQQVLGRFFSHRQALSTLAASGFGLVAALFVDNWRNLASEESAVFGYTAVLLVGALFLGLASPAFMARMPEPLMQQLSGSRPSLKQMLSSPLRDANFRQLMKFLFVWSFALNLAVPFFAVYMLMWLKLPLSGVIALSVLNQLSNVLFLRLWGPLADRFNSKVILSLSASLYLLVILGWTSTTMPDKFILTIPLLVVLHIFAGAASAGVTLTVGTIGLKLAPQGQATPYLACASVATNLGAGLGPLVGGLFAATLTGYGFLPPVAFLIGLVALNMLTSVREEGEVGREVVLEDLRAHSLGVSRAVSLVPGLRFVARSPLGYLRHVPGVDVALGVTAYQVASLSRTAVAGANHVLGTGADIASRMGHAIAGLEISGLEEETEELGVEGADLVRHVAGKAIHALGEIAGDIGHLAEESVKAELDAVGRVSIDPEEAF